MLVTVQPWGLRSVSGGSRILNALLADPPMAVHSICTSPTQPQATDHISESHVPARPSLGRLDRSRFSRLGSWLDRPFRHMSRRHLRKTYQELGASAIHIVAHGYAFAAAYLAARDLDLPVLLTVHDDLRYTLSGHPDLRRSLAALREVWCGADRRIAITDEMGDEYCSRYGAKPFLVITDGLEALSNISAPIGEDSSHTLYFMGLLHHGYLPNIEAVLKATQIHGGQEPPWRVIIRCGLTELPIDQALTEHLTLLPYGTQKDVEADMAQASALYQPLAIGPQYDDMNRFSLSTKMVTYLGSGKPIFFHGPADSAASRLLKRWDAALASESLDPSEIARVLRRCAEEGPKLAENARRLAMDRFMLADQRGMFWNAVSEAIGEHHTAR
jgi:hypothetical protein